MSKLARFIRHSCRLPIYRVAPELQGAEQLASEVRGTGCSCSFSDPCSSGRLSSSTAAAPIISSGWLPSLGRVALGGSIFPVQAEALMRLHGYSTEAGPPDAPAQGAGPPDARVETAGTPELLSEAATPSEENPEEPQEVDLLKFKRYRKRVTRKEKGSWQTTLYDDLDDEYFLADPPPFEGPAYDVRGAIDKQLMEEKKMSPTMPDMDALEQEAKELGLYVPVTPKEYEGKPHILRWEVRIVLSPGGEAWHPANRKVRLQVYVRDLDLSERARERFVALVGPRYNKAKDELTLVSERYKHREENRKDVLRILYALIEEAKQADLYLEEAAAA